METEIDPQNVVATKVLARIIHIMSKNKKGYQWSISEQFVGSLKTLLNLKKDEYIHVLNTIGLIRVKLPKTMEAIQFLVECIRNEGTECSYSYEKQKVTKNGKNRNYVMLLKLHDDNKKWDWKFDEHSTTANKATIQEVKDEYTKFLHQFPGLLTVGNKASSNVPKQCNDFRSIERMLMEDLAEIFKFHKNKIREENTKRACYAVKKYLERYLVI